MSQRFSCAAFLGFAFAIVHGAGATELVYVPVNPNFGGAPNNAAGLLAGASAVNKHGAQTPGGSLLNQTPLQQFNQTLERMVLGQLASSATSKLMGQDGKLAPGTFTTENFVITVTDLGGGVLRVTTTEKGTGTVTSFEVGQ
ncbi:MAG: curli assembly protein CsgF [Massilia sp.]|nr:curli assembly protein CsgF [Massilia sp.]